MHIPMIEAIYTSKNHPNNVRYLIEKPVETFTEILGGIGEVGRYGLLSFLSKLFYNCFIDTSVIDRL